MDEDEVMAVLGNSPTDGQEFDDDTVGDEPDTELDDDNIDDDNDADTSDTSDEDQSGDDDIADTGADDAKPEPKPARAKFTPQLGGQLYSPEEEAQLGEMLTSLDPKQVFQANQYMIAKNAAAAEERMLASQVASASDLPSQHEAMVRQELLQLSRTNPNVYSDPQALEAARFGAAFKMGIQNGDIQGTIQELMFPDNTIQKPAVKPPNRTIQQAAPSQRMPAPSVADPRTATGGRGTGNAISREISRSILGEDMSPEMERDLMRAFKNSARWRR